MFKPSPKHIANKIIILVLALELISISFWGTLTYNGSKRELLNTINSKLVETAIRTSISIGQFFVPLDNEIKALNRMLSALSVSQEQQQILFNLFLKNHPSVEEISLIDDANRESLRISRMQGISRSDLRDLSNNELLKQIRNKQQTIQSDREISHITFSKYFEPQVEIIYPLKEKNELVLLKVNLKWLWDAVQDQVIDASGYVYVLNDKLDLIAHQDPSYVLKGLNLNDTRIPQSLLSVPTTEKLHIYKNFSDIKVAGVSHFDELHKWWIIVEQPVTEGLAPLTRVINQFITAFFITAIITIIIVIYFTKRTMHPLEKLEQGISQLANGQREVQIEVAGNDELASLADSFNTMASSLDEHISNILETHKILEDSQKALQVSERRVRMLLNSTAEAIYGIDNHGICTFCNPATLRYLGFGSIEEVVGKPIDRSLRISSTSSEQNIDEIMNIHIPTKLGNGIHNEDVLICKTTGDCFHVELRSYPIKEDNEVVGAVITFTDITDRYTYQKALKYQAYHDSLTDLPNRTLLHEHLETLFDKQPPQSAALMLIDLDRFKEVNDSLGHKSGDMLLKMLGPRIQKLLDADDLLARLGGDEFAILLRSLTSESEAIEFSQKVLEQIKKPFDLEEMQIQIDASIGIALCPCHGQDSSTLMRFADVAMYHAKVKRSGFAVYNQELDAHSPQRLALLGELRNAIDDNQLTLHYQPKIRMQDKQLIGFEALVRWEHPKHGLIPPDEFIPLAELGDLINPLTLWVIEKAISDRQLWQEETSSLVVAVNVSVRNLQDIDIVEKIKNSLYHSNVSHEHLEIEITESAIMIDPIRAQETLQQIYDLGIRISIDDYGTGYSSLAYLKKLPVDYLKIDRSFVMDMASNDNDALIVRSTIDLAHNLGLEVIAEGVESKNEWDLLAILGCDYSQGYFISRPIKANEINNWCEQWQQTAS